MYHDVISATNYKCKLTMHANFANLFLKEFSTQTVRMVVMIIGKNMPATPKPSSLQATSLYLSLYLESSRCLELKICSIVTPAITEVIARAREHACMYCESDTHTYVTV